MSTGCKKTNLLPTWLVTIRVKRSPGNGSVCYSALSCTNEISTAGTLFQKVNGQWLKRAVSKQNQFEMPEGMQLQ